MLMQICSLDTQSFVCFNLHEIIVIYLIYISRLHLHNDTTPE